MDTETEPGIGYHSEPDAVLQIQVKPVLQASSPEAPAADKFTEPGVEQPTVIQFPARQTQTSSLGHSGQSFPSANVGANSPTTTFVEGVVDTFEPIVDNRPGL